MVIAFKEEPTLSLFGTPKKTSKTKLYHFRIQAKQKSLTIKTTRDTRDKHGDKDHQDNETQ